MLEPPKGWEYFDPETIPYFNAYYKWDGKDGLTFTTRKYIDPSDRFVINFSPEWEDKVTLDTKSVQDKSLKFIMSDTGETVAEVSFFTPVEWDRVKNAGWDLLGRDMDKIIGYRGELEQSTTWGDGGKDEESIRSFIVINLKRNGFEVLEAADGHEALHKLTTIPDIDIALLDVMVPGIDGFKVQEQDKVYALS
ncbi:hypothetical protein KC345_g12086, partial [Hortaea werneckii]